VPIAVPQALEAWLKVHPLARGVALLDEQPLLVRLGRHAHEQQRWSRAASYQHVTTARGA
jgi:hypothetical protein